MKILFVIIACFTLIIFTSCNARKEVTIRTTNGDEFTAKVAPAIEDQISISDTGRIIAILKLKGFVSTDDEFVYNYHYWQPKDTSSLGGLIRREFKVGTIIDVK